MSTETIPTNLTSATRLGSTVNGNPMWMLHTSQGDFRLSNDSAASYGVNNLIPRHGDESTPVILHLTRAGRVSRIEIPEF